MQAKLGQSKNNSSCEKFRKKLNGRNNIRKIIGGHNPVWSFIGTKQLDCYGSTHNKGIKIKRGISRRMWIEGIREYGRKRGKTLK